MLPDNSIMHHLRQACGELHVDTTEMLDARIELAQLELRLASARAKRMSALVGVCGLTSLTGYVILVHLAAEQITVLGGLSHIQTLLLVGCGMFAVGGLFAWLAVRRFCSKFRHFEQTQNELRADLQAVQNWLNRGSASV